MGEGEDAEHETRLLRIIDTLAACGDIAHADAKLFREAVEDGLRARDLLNARGAQFEVYVEPDPERTGVPEIDAAMITFHGAFESMTMRRWANRWAGLHLREE